MLNMIIGEYFLQDGLNTTESPKVFHCAPVSRSRARPQSELCPTALQAKFLLAVVEHLG